MSCRYCSNIRIHSSSSPHQPTFASLVQSARTCELCRLIYQTINNNAHTEWLAKGNNDADYKPLYLQAGIYGNRKKIHWFTDLVVSAFDPKSTGFAGDLYVGGGYGALELVADEGSGGLLR
jgi:hypothetical protein